MPSKYGFQYAGEQSKFGFGTVGRSGGTRVSSMPKGWKTMGKKEAMGKIGVSYGSSNPQVYDAFKKMIVSYYDNKATSAPMAPAGTAGAAGSSMSPSARSAYEKALAHYKPGGGFGKGVEAGLERGRVKSTASGMQNLVSAGLAGTSMAAGLGKKYEEEVGAPTRARLEGARAEAMANIQMSMAGTEQRGYESAQDRQFQMQMQQRSLDAQQQGYNTQLMASSMRGSDDGQVSALRSQLDDAIAKLRTRSQPSGPTTHKAPKFSFDSAPTTKAPYKDPLVGQPMYSATGTGMYLGGGKYLTARQLPQGYGQ